MELNELYKMNIVGPTARSISRQLHRLLVLISLATGDPGQDMGDRLEGKI